MNPYYDLQINTRVWLDMDRLMAGFTARVVDFTRDIRDGRRIAIFKADRPQSGYHGKTYEWFCMREWPLPAKPDGSPWIIASTPMLLVEPWNGQPLTYPNSMLEPERSFIELLDGPGENDTYTGSTWAPEGFSVTNSTQIKIIQEPDQEPLKRIIQANLENAVPKSKPIRLCLGGLANDKEWATTQKFCQRWSKLEGHQVIFWVLDDPEFHLRRCSAFAAFGWEDPGPSMRFFLLRHVEVYKLVHLVLRISKMSIDSLVVGDNGQAIKISSPPAPAASMRDPMMTFESVKLDTDNIFRASESRP